MEEWASCWHYYWCTKTLRNQNLSKSERVKHVFDTKVGKISKSDISKLCPDISVTTIEKALVELLKEEYIVKVGGGRSTAYIVKNWYKLHIISLYNAVWVNDIQRYSEIVSATTSPHMWSVAHY